MRAYGDTNWIENMPNEQALWYESNEDKVKKFSYFSFLEAFRLEMEMLAFEILTPRQIEYFDLFMDGMTEREIAACLQVVPSSVHYAIKGRNGFGGIIKKLKKEINMRDDYKKYERMWRKGAN